MFPGGKGGRWVGLTTLPPSRIYCLEIWEPQPPGTLWACPGLQWDCFSFLYTTTTMTTKIKMQQILKGKKDNTN
jgi:hypothetical protein